MHDITNWKHRRDYSEEELALARAVLEDVLRGVRLQQAVRRHPLPGGAGFLAKHALVAAYRGLVEQGEWEEDPALLAAIRMKPIRTLSGVTTLTVLTKPNPCPGECLFCPTETDMPQSYLSDEPGARRGLENDFDPYRQVTSRLRALHEVGHPTDKIELLILGGSWSAYTRQYREWFVRRCFEALNEENPADDHGLVPLEEVHALNVSGKHRNVGLVIETRPDLIDRDELLFNRWLGVTKVQIGVQSMDDTILALNRRGHTAASSVEAAALLRAGGFKVVAHWMPNLIGASLASDREDFIRLWQADGLDPDELKIYPCQLLRNSALYAYWQRGEYHPYTEAELLALLVDIKPTVPCYCRINRVIRDIPSPNVVEGNKNTSLRQDALRELERLGRSCSCIRCREVRRTKVSKPDLILEDLVYQAGHTEEHFISYNTDDDKLAGFLRLSLPKVDNVLDIPDLAGAAIIREVHVYGQALEVGVEQSGAAQHSGLGRQLLREAEKIAQSAGFARLAVISAVGTRDYYAASGYVLKKLYMVKAFD